MRKAQATIELTLSLTALIALFAGMVALFGWATKSVVDRHNDYFDTFKTQYNSSVETFTPERLNMLPDIASAYVSDLGRVQELIRTLGDIFQNGRSGEFYYNFIAEKGIIIKYGATPGNVNAYWSAETNTITINELLWDNLPESAIAGILAHELTHADYSYNPQQWIDLTKQENPGLADKDIHIPGDSIDQEYRAFYNAAKAYEQLRAQAGTTATMEELLAMINNGEDFAKASIAMTYTWLTPY